MTIFVRPDGSIIGEYLDGATPTDPGAVPALVDDGQGGEVDAPRPADGRDTWDSQARAWVPYAPPPLSYRQRRAMDYAAELPQGGENSAIIALGDMVDALVDAVYRGDQTKLGALVVKVDAIKARHPKP